LLCFVIMGMHFHLLLKAPRSDLSAGTRNFLSGHAIWAGRRWRREGHLFQARYRGEMIDSGHEAELCRGGAVLRLGRLVVVAASRRNLARAVAAWLRHRRTEGFETA
jgi:hypothetical protein